MTTQTQHAGPDERSELIKKLYELGALLHADEEDSLACVAEQAAALMADSKAGGEVFGWFMRLGTYAPVFLEQSDPPHPFTFEEAVAEGWRPLYAHPQQQADSKAGGEVVAVCDGKEQEAFEAWAKKEGYDMSQHPLHWLFLNHKTHSARKGWKAAIEYASAQTKQQAAQAAVPQGLVLVQGYERLIDQYIEEYEFTDGDSGYHDPSEFEQAMIKDALMGFDFSSLFSSAPAPVEQKGEA